MLTRGAELNAAARLCSLAGVLGPDGCASGCGTGCCLPFTTLVLGGLAVGKYLLAAQLQPSSTRALSTTARIKFLLSFTLGSSWYRIVTLAAPGMATKYALESHPAPTSGAIALDCSDRIGRAARLVAAARRQDL